jgi:hypothetical protein
MNPIINPLSRTNVSVPQAILVGTLIAGTLDALDGVVAFGLQGMNPIQVLQYIASGAIGASAFQGGLATAGLGALLHFFIAAVVTVTYIGASRFFGSLRDKPGVWGPIYGAAVYFVMNYGVLPRSGVAPSPFSLSMFLNGVIGHALFVGLPIALYARRSTVQAGTTVSDLQANGVRS